MSRLLPRAVTWAAIGLLAGCGFHPLYAPGGATNASLNQVFVDIIPNRDGQLLRQALQERLDGSAPAEKHYILSVVYSTQYEAEGVQQDTSITRNRFIGSAHWVLRKPGALGTAVASGTAHTMDGNNNINSQFFYSDLNSNDVNRRMGASLADAIVEQIAAYFRAHPAAAA